MSSETVWQEVAQTGQETLAVIEDTFGSLPNMLTLGKRLGISLLLLFAGFLLWRSVKRYVLPRVRSVWPVKLFPGLILGFAVAAGILSVWGFDVYNLLGTPPGRSIFGSFVTIGLGVLGAYILWEFVNYLLYRHLLAMDLGESMEKRIQTVLPLARRSKPPGMSRIPEEAVMNSKPPQACSRWPKKSGSRAAWVKKTPHRRLSKFEF